MIKPVEQSADILEIINDLRQFTPHLRDFRLPVLEVEKQST